MIAMPSRTCAALWNRVLAGRNRVRNSILTSTAQQLPMSSAILACIIALIGRIPVTDITVKDCHQPGFRPRWLVDSLYVKLVTPWVYKLHDHRVRSLQIVRSPRVADRAAQFSFLCWQRWQGSRWRKNQSDCRRLFLRIRIRSRCLMNFDLLMI